MKTQYIAKNDKVLGGSYVIVGTRIPAERLTHLIKSGYTEENLAKEFPGLPPAKIRGALNELLALGLRQLSA